MDDKTIFIKQLIKTGKKNEYCVVTSLDEYTFHEDLIVKYNLVPEREISKKDLEKILNESKKIKLLGQVINYYSFRNRSQKEVDQYLTKKKATEEEKEYVINYLKDIGYLNHSVYSKEFLLSSLRNMKGPKYIEEELKNRGIDKDTIIEVISSYTDEMQQEIVTKIVQKEIEKSTTLPIRKRQMLIYNKLLRNGFDLSIAKNAIDSLELIDDSSISLRKDFDKLLIKYNEELTYNTKNRIIQNLISKGYEYKDIMNLFNCEE